MARHPKFKVGDRVFHPNMRASKIVAAVAPYKGGPDWGYTLAGDAGNLDEGWVESDLTALPRNAAELIEGLPAGSYVQVFHRRDGSWLIKRTSGSGFYGSALYAGITTKQEGETLAEALAAIPEQERD